jgi:hypothetical protein
MSNALAIAAVTETLVHLLNGALEGAHVAGAQVTALRPDASSGLPPAGVNVFLYQVSPNPYLRNADLPTRKADGTLLRRPRAALDLHYLLTFYGDDTQLEQQRLLGAVARELHAQPLLSRNLIASVQQNVNFLNAADLDQQSELVHFTPINFSLEELSKLWSFLLKTDYVLCTAYVASVVLIEADVPIAPPPLPVLASNIYALPFRQPVVTQIKAAQDPNALILPGSQIVVSGRNFLYKQVSESQTTTETTRVMIGSTPQSPVAVSDTQITVNLPPGLQAGSQSAQVIQSLNIGTPPVPHQQGFQSDVAPFVLHPVIEHIGSPPSPYAITFQTNVGSPPGDVVTVGVEPTVRAGQQALLELLQISDPNSARLFASELITSDTNTISFPVGGAPPGNYLVRVRIDGAESPFDLDPSGSPVAPNITL